ASGPSLTRADCEKAQEWAQEEGRGVIVVNTSFRVAPWADVLYAMDLAWWKTYWPEVMRVFRGERIAPFKSPYARKIRFDGARNSGASAIALAAYAGARRIILIGYDCQYTGGRR